MNFILVTYWNKMFLKHRRSSKDMDEQLFTEKVHKTFKHEKACKRNSNQGPTNQNNSEELCFHLSDSQGFRSGNVECWQKASHEPPS